MKRNGLSRRRRRSWKAYAARDGVEIDAAIRAGRNPCCPCCGEMLEAQPGSRLSPCVVLDARAYDLSCRGCRRFWCVVQHTPRSIRFIRMRRFAAAVKAVDVGERAGPASATATTATPAA